MSREDIIDKIRKLRNLSGNQAASIAEAATAARLAEELLQKHQIAEAEMEIELGTSEQVIEDQTALTDWNKKQTVWQNILLTHLCKAYNCEGLLKKQAGKINYFAMGRPSDLATLRYQYSYFVLELTRLAALLAPPDLQRGSGKTWHKSFYLGATHAIAEALATVKREVVAQSNSAALMILDKHHQEVLDLKKKLYPNSIQKEIGHSNIDANAYRTGQQAGSNLKAKPGLDAGVKGLLS